MNFSGIVDWIRRALSESDGTPSSLRPPFWFHDFILGLCIVSVVVFTLWSHYHDPKNPFNPTAIGAVLAGWFTINRGSKIVQKGVEATPAQETSSLPSKL